jgi:hypothetical protein
MIEREETQRLRLDLQTGEENDTAPRTNKVKCNMSHEIPLERGQYEELSKVELSLWKVGDCLNLPA